MMTSPGLNPLTARMLVAGAAVPCASAGTVLLTTVTRTIAVNNMERGFSNLDVEVNGYAPVADFGCCISGI
jgi:hypothetical protein